MDSNPDADQSQLPIRIHERQVLYQAPSSSVRRERLLSATEWQHALTWPQERQNPILLSQPAQRVLSAIREIFGARRPFSKTEQASEYYHQPSQCIKRRQLCVDRSYSSGGTSGKESKSLHTPSPSCGIQQRLPAREQTTQGMQHLTSDPGGEKSSYFIQKDDTPKKKKMSNHETCSSKRGSQQSPITDYFQERRSSPEKRTKRVKMELDQETECQSKMETTTDAQKTTAKTRLLDVSLMGMSQRKAFERNLKSAEEVACTLLYQDGSSLLRPTNNQQKLKKQADGDRIKKVDALVVALPWTDDEENESNANLVHRKSRLVIVRIPLNDTDTDRAQWSRETMRKLMASSTRKICYDAQKLVRSLLETLKCDEKSVSLNWRLLDPKVASWLLTPDHPPQSFADALASVQLHLSEEEENLHTAICRDISLLGPLMMQLYNRLKELILWDLFIALETPLRSMLAVMEMEAIEINSQVLIDASTTLKKKIHQVEKESHKAAGRPFLINSPQQLREVLFDELRLDQKCKKKLPRTTIKNYKSTSEAVLLDLQELHPLPKLVLQYRHLVKLKSTYFDGILSHVKDGVLFTKWEQTAAATGRLTSTNPNLQAIPKQPIEITGIKKQCVTGKPDEVVKIYARDAYRSREGCLLLAAELSYRLLAKFPYHSILHQHVLQLHRFILGRQEMFTNFQSIELRLLSHLSDDPSLLQIFNNDQGCTDVFTTLTSQWLGIKFDEVQLQERERTKRIVYSVIYGVGRERLGRTLKVSGEEAKGFMESFLGRFPGIKEFTRRSIEQCQRYGYVSTILNRRRWLPHIKSHDFGQRSQAERQAVNFIVQGSAADIGKAAMIQVMTAIAQDPTIHARLLLQIHDELLLEVPESEIQKVTALVKSTMESTDRLCGGKVKLKVSLPVSISTGRTWGQMNTCMDSDIP